MDTCLVHHLGSIPFSEARELQETLAAQIAAGSRPATLLLLEHPPTFTFGRRGKPEDLLWDQETQVRRGVEVHWTDRGGAITYHGPGQLVGYPLLPLSPPGTPSRGDRIPQANYLGYLRDLERLLVRVLAGYQIAAGQIPGLTGVWVQPDVASRCRHCPPELRQNPSKIASIGVKVDAAGLSRHGFALNIATDRSYWEAIIGCGLEGYGSINLADLLDPAPPMEDVMQAVSRNFGQVFGFQMRLTKL